MTSAVVLRVIDDDLSSLLAPVLSDIAFSVVLETLSLVARFPPISTKMTYQEYAETNKY